jgi:polyphosphate kinase
VVFRIIRDADVAVEEDDAAELMEAMQAAILARRRRAVVQLTLSANPDPRLKDWLTRQFGVSEREVYEIDGMLDASVLMQLAGRPGFENLKYADWPPQRPRGLIGQEDLWGSLQEQDLLLFHPYEAFDPVIQLVSLAADDPSVLAIKQTLYRTSGDSPIVAALARAAENGKQVTVLVELKARFDEAKNVQWARKLEDAGCYVIYGIAGYKTHAKALLIVRREAHRIRRYVHLSTGNYNDKTARLYSDLGLMTSDGDMTADAASFFNLLTGYSQAVGWSKFSIAPTGLRQRFLDLIDREIQASTPDRPGLIMAKVNSLQDPKICKALYQASQAGVRVQLNVRGICCLRPGVPGVSDNIDVISIVDRYLEHARIFYFRNGGHEEIYMSSADWMVRNLEKRLEIMFPVPQPAQKKRLTNILRTYFADNVKARRLGPDGCYHPVPRSGAAVRAQEQFYREAVEAARTDPRGVTEFRPLTSPEEKGR